MSTDELVLKIKEGINKHYSYYELPFEEMDIMNFEKAHDITFDKFTYYYLARISKKFYFRDFATSFNIILKPKIGHFAYGTVIIEQDYYSIEKTFLQKWQTNTLKGVINHLHGVYIFNIPFDDKSVVYLLSIEGNKKGEIWTLRQVGDQYILQKKYDNMLLAIHQELNNNEKIYYGGHQHWST
jgi:hypothetical protein